MSMPKKRKIYEESIMSMLKKRKMYEESKSFLLNRVKPAFRDEPEKYQSFLRIVAGASRSGNSPESISLMSRDLQVLFSSSPDLVLGFNRFLPVPHQIPLPDHNLNLDLNLDRFVEFVDEVRSRFRGDESGIYNQFLRLLNRYRKSLDLDEARVCSDVCDLFDGHDDLQRFFNSLFSDSVDKSQNLENQGLALFKRARAKLGDEDNLTFLKSFFEYSKGLITGVELGMNVADLVNHCPVILEELSTFLGRCERGQKSTRAPSSSSSSHEHECASLDHNNPSYRARAQRSIFGEEEVLNDAFVCEYRGGGVFRHRLPRSNERRMLDSWEDEHDDLDVLVHVAGSTARRAREQWELLSSGARGVHEARLLFPETGLRCIKNIYGEEGEHVVRLMLEDPLRRIPVVIARLQQKEREWREALEELRGKRPNFML